MACSNPMLTSCVFNCPPPRVRGAIVVSGKNLCLSVTQFLMACNSETVEEIDTKLVLLVATPADVFCIENISAKSRSTSAGGVFQIFVSGLSLKHFLIDTCADLHACS